MESTNDMWNRLCLNSKWSVGCVSELIQTRKWGSKEEWEKFYYESGKERLALLGNNADTLNNFRMTYSQYMNQPDELKNINFYHGRTQEDLKDKAIVLYQAVQHNGYLLSVRECYECVRFRTICQTWNGIVVAENRCIQILSQRFPTLEFRKSIGDRDYAFEVDYEVFRNGTLILALQIKPSSYFGYSSYLYDARMINANKFKSYKDLTGVDVEIVVYDKKSSDYITNLNNISNKISSLI